MTNKTTIPTQKTIITVGLESELLLWLLLLLLLNVNTPWLVLSVGTWMAPSPILSPVSLSLTPSLDLNLSKNGHPKRLLSAVIYDHLYQIWSSCLPGCPVRSVWVSSCSRKSSLLHIWVRQQSKMGHLTRSDDVPFGGRFSHRRGVFRLVVNSADLLRPKKKKKNI